MKLEAVRIPPRLQDFAAGDAQVFDVTLAGDRVQAIVPSASQARARGTLLSALVEDSLWVDFVGRPRATRQLVVSAEAPASGIAIGWSFKRVR